MSEFIHRINLKTMKTIGDKPKKTVKQAVKQISIVERNMEIARARGMTIDDQLKYDVAPSPLLFTEDGIMTSPQKSQLLKEMETHLESKDYNYSHSSDSSFIIDRKIHLGKLTDCNGFLAAFASFTDAFRHFGCCHYVFDMYTDEPSVKDSERRRRPLSRLLLSLSFMVLYSMGRVLKNPAH